MRRRRNNGLNMRLRRQDTAKSPALRRYKPRELSRLSADEAGYIYSVLCSSKLRPSLQLFEGASPRGPPCLCADEADYLYSALVLICRVLFTCCNRFASPLAAVWAPAWAPRSSPCDRSYVQRLHLTEGTSPRWPPCHITDEAGNIYSALLLICQVLFSWCDILLLLRQRRVAA
jgi:hypothetical protein